MKSLIRCRWLTPFFLLLALSAPVLAQPITLVTLGDSLTAGAGDSASDVSGAPLGYPGRLLGSLLANNPGSSLLNLAQSGWTTGELILGTDYDGSPGQLPAAVDHLRQAIAQGQQGYALLWTGSNDLWAIYEWKCDSQSPASCGDDDLNQFRGHLQTLLEQLAATGARVLVGLLDDHSRRPVVADPAYRDSFPEITREELPLLAERVVQYNQTISELAQKYGAQTVDFYHTSLFEQTATLSEDGNHPNAAGYQQIAALWLDAVTRPQADILADSQQGPVVLATGKERLALSLNLHAGREQGRAADWFLVQVTPAGSIRSLDLATLGFKDGLFASYQNRLFDLQDFTLDLDASAWPSGRHTLYFGIDLVMDGPLSVPSYYDWVVVDVP